MFRFSSVLHDDYWYESEDQDAEDWHYHLQNIKENRRFVTHIGLRDYHNHFIKNMNHRELEDLGKAISNNTNLTLVKIVDEALCDDMMPFFFGGLTASASLQNLELPRNDISASGVKDMEPFLRNASNLLGIDLRHNNIESEGFNFLLRALCDSPVQNLICNGCGIKSLEIETELIPKKLKILSLSQNNINTPGCRGLAKLLRGGSTLQSLALEDNDIDDECIAILVDALKCNASLEELHMRENDRISSQGCLLLLKLVNDASNVTATLHSNHTLKRIGLSGWDDIKKQISESEGTNRKYESLAGREKVIKFQLHSKNRANLCRLQEIDRSPFSEIDPLHLPEVLSLVDRRHKHKEFHVALSSSIMALFLTINREKCIEQEREYHEAQVAEHKAKIAAHEARLEELGKELATIKQAKARDQIDVDSRNKKRRIE